MSETMTKGHAEGSSVAPAGGSASARAPAVQTSTDAAAWWQQHDQRVYQCIKLWVEQWYPPQHDALLDAVAQVFGEHRASVRETLTNLKERVIRLEATSNFEERFTKLAHEAKGGSEIPQGELLAKIEGLQRQADEFNRVTDLDVLFRELAERVTELEKTNSLEARFTKLADKAKGGSEFPQDELLAKIEGLQRQADEFNRVADLDVLFRELAERVGELEKTNSLEERFSQLEHQLAARQGTLLSQDQLLEKIEARQRQVDGNRVADLDARFRELAERVTELEKTNNLEARFNKLANEVKHSDIPQSALLARIDGLQRQLDELKTEPGPQGPPGAPGKLPRVKEYVADCVHYEGDVVTHDGALWQARGDTVHGPQHSDWVCLARAGRDGLTPTIRGTYDAYGKYNNLDIVALDGASFIARHDDPGICPGDGWQLMSRQGRPGRKGEMGERGLTGPKGDKGAPGEAVPQIVSFKLDRPNYRFTSFLSNGNIGPELTLRELLEYFLSEVGSPSQWTSG